MPRIKIGGGSHIYSESQFDPSNQITITTSGAGNLAYDLAAEGIGDLDICNLKITGAVNDEDMLLVRRFKNLLSLDISATDATTIHCDELRVLHSVKLPNTLTSISENAFLKCGFLQYVGSEYITEIQRYAFNECHSLMSVNLPNVEKVGSYAFGYCESLSELNLPNAYELDSGCFCSTGISTLVLSDKLEVLPNDMCNSCSNLKQFVCPDNLRRIGGWAFASSALEEIKINEGLEEIDNSALRANLTEVTLPSSIKKLGRDGVSENTRVVKSFMTAPNFGNFFNSISSEAILYVPAYALLQYKIDDSTLKFKEIRVLEGEEASVLTVNSDFSLRTTEGLVANPDVRVNENLVFNVETPLNANDFYLNVLPSKDAWDKSNTTTLIVTAESSAKTATVRMRLDENRWNFISFPFDVRISDIQAPGNTLWVVRKYSGENRAALKSESTWLNLEENEILQAGKGYILHFKEGENFSGKEEDRYVFAFPSCDKASGLVAGGDVTVPLQIYSSAELHSESWNLTGNPYPANFVCTDNTDFNQPITVYNGSGYTAYSLIDDNYVLKPFEAFFVQALNGTNSITFKGEGRCHYKDRPSMIAPSYRPSSDRAILNFTIDDGENSDRTRIVLNEKASATYEISCDASKFMSMDETVPQIFSMEQGVRMAINERPLGEGRFTLGAVIPADGEYSISLNTRDAEEYTVTLTDLLSGETCDLTVDSYQFAAVAGTGNERFLITVSRGSGVDGITETAGRINLDGNFLTVDAARGASVCTLDGKTVATASEGTLETVLENGIYVVKAGDRVRKLIVR